jgi:hypothetical protein
MIKTSGRNGPCRRTHRPGDVGRIKSIDKGVFTQFPVPARRSGENVSPTSGSEITWLEALDLLLTALTTLFPMPDLDSLPTLTV